MIITLRVIALVVFCRLLFYTAVADAQQSLTPQQQCSNYQQELVLADISHQEARARSGNIMRQAYELESQVKELTKELVKEKEAHADTKKALDNVKEFLVKQNAATP